MAREASGASQRPKRGPGVRSQVRRPQSRRDDFVDGDDRGPPGVGQDGHPAALRAGLLRKPDGRGDQFFLGPEAEDAGLVKNGFGQVVLLGQDAGMGRRGAGSLGRPAGLQGQDGLAGGDARGDVEKAAQIFKRFDVEHDGLGSGIAADILEKLIQAQVGFVPVAGVHPQTQAGPVQVELQGLPHTPTLGQDGDAARSHRHEGEIGVNGEQGVRALDALRIGPAEAQAVSPGDPQDPVLKIPAASARFLETGGVDDGELDALPPAFLQHAGNQSTADGDVDEIHLARHVQDRRKGPERADGGDARVDQMNRAPVTMVQQVLQDPAADAQRLAGDADDADRPGSEQRLKHAAPLGLPRRIARRRAPR